MNNTTLLNSALLVEAVTRIHPEDLRPVSECTRKMPAVFVSTANKSQAQIVREAVKQMRRAGMLKETPRSRQIKVE